VPRPDLSQPLAYPITPTGAPPSHLLTLMDAAILIRDRAVSSWGSPRRDWPHEWPATLHKCWWRVRKIGHLWARSPTETSN